MQPIVTERFFIHRCSEHQKFAGYKNVTLLTATWSDDIVRMVHISVGFVTDVYDLLQLYELTRKFLNAMVLYGGIVRSSDIILVHYPGNHYWIVY